MKKGRVRITNFLISDALGFPMNWKIEKIEPTITPSESRMIIPGNDFPETTELGEIEDVCLVVHKESIRYEVKKSNTRRHNG